MIDIRDLFFGCWVQYADYGPGRVIKIAQVYATVCFRHRTGNVIAETIEGVPLTQELMKKLDFGIKEDCAGYTLYEGPEEIYVMVRKLEPLVGSVKMVFPRFTVPVTVQFCRFLHELQWLYRSETGKHLEVKL